MRPLSWELAGRPSGHLARRPRGRHRRPVPASSNYVLVYPARYSGLFGVVLSAFFGLPMLIGLVLVVAGTHLSFGWIVADVVLMFIGLALVYSWIIFAAGVLRQLVRPRPMLLIDSDGVECRAGRVAWADVEHVGFVDRSTSEAQSKWLCLYLRPGAELLATSLHYYGGFLDDDAAPARTECGLELPLSPRVQAGVEHHYQGEIRLAPL